jgi:2,4-dienoyl-CoA reductase-like NADH-dependent reductase (Old Yellow Enzyme family)/thioredoxin reductase
MTKGSLFEPGFIGPLKVKNRIVFPALASKLSTADGAVSDDYIAFLEARARGGVGLIVIENTTVDWQGGKGGSTLTRADGGQFVPRLHSLVERVHAYGVKIGTQLQHVGRQTRGEFTHGRAPVAPSVIAPVLGADPPHELTPPEIDRIIRQFADAARRSREAGCDFVEIHGAHGYLITQFLSPLLNRRTDEYGGSLAGRLRFALRVVEAVRGEVGPDFPVLFRLSVDEHVEGGTPFEEILLIAQELERAGVSAIDVTAGLYESKEWIFPPLSTDEGYNVQAARTLKKTVGIPVIVVGKIADRHLAERVIDEGSADFVAMGRPLLADPMLPRKWRFDAESDVVPCIYCNDCINHAARQWQVRCTVNPEAGRERLVTTTPSFAPSKSVLVVGGGPGGMQAALSLAKAGHRVTLCERRSQLGGALPIAALPPHKERLGALVASFLHRIKQAEGALEVRLDTEVTATFVTDFAPDAVVVATGAAQAGDFEQENGVVSVPQALSRPGSLGPKSVVVGGDRIGCEVAEALAAHGVSVTLVEPGSAIALGVESNTRTALLARLAVADVSIHTDVKILGRTGQGVRAEFGGTIHDLSADSVVSADGWAPDRALADELESQLGVPVVRVGDCVEARGLLNAIHEGSDAIKQIEAALPVL